MIQLQLFTNPETLRWVQRNILDRFLDDMKQYLPPEYTTLLSSDISFEEYCSGLASLFRSLKGFGAPLVQALADIDTLALPDNRALLDDAVAHSPPNFIDTNKSPLNQSLHLWLISQGIYGVTFPISSLNLSLADPPIENRKSKIENSNGSPIQNQNPKIQNGSSEPSTFNLQPATVPSPHQSIPGLSIENQKSKIENSKSSAPASNPDAHTTPNTEHAIRHESSPICPGVQIENRKSTIEIPNAPLCDPPLSDALARLAKLSEVDYELVRRDEAKRLGLRLRALDDAVEAARIRDDDAEAEKIGISLIVPWPEPILDPPALFDQVHDRALLYFYLPAGAAVVLTLWPAHAHVIKAFTQTPRLNLTSIDPGCGKSTVLNYVATLCPKVFSTDNLRPAVLFRVVARHQPTTVLDELDTYIHLYPELRGLLNAGHDPDACVHRVENHKIRAFKSFAATALAGLGHLSPTLRSRSIIIPLSEAPPGSLKLRFDKRKLDVENILARKIARWTLDHFDAIAACDPPMPTYNRLADNWRPLFAVAQVIGGHWPQRILDAFYSLTQHRHPDAKPNGDLLADIRNAFAKAGVNRMPCKQLAQALVALGHHPAGNSSPDDPRWLSRRLSALGISSRNLRFGHKQSKGYELSDFITSYEPSPTSSFT